MGWRPVRLTCVTDLIDTTEMYLRTIFELEEEGITPLRARIAERLGHSGPTVSQTVARMERDGLLMTRRMVMMVTGATMASPSNEASAGRRRVHLTTFSHAPTGRAKIGSWRSHRSRSSAKSAAVA